MNALMPTETKMSMYSTDCKMFILIKVSLFVFCNQFVQIPVFGIICLQSGIKTGCLNKINLFNLNIFKRIFRKNVNTILYDLNALMPTETKMSMYSTDCKMFILIKVSLFVFWISQKNMTTYNLIFFYQVSK
jgi:hypothetical protein